MCVCVCVCVCVCLSVCLSVCICLSLSSNASVFMFSLLPMFDTNKHTQTRVVSFQIFLFLSSSQAHRCTHKKKKKRNPLVTQEKEAQETKRQHISNIRILYFTYTHTTQHTTTLDNSSTHDVPHTKKNKQHNFSLFLKKKIKRKIHTHMYGHSSTMRHCLGLSAGCEYTHHFASSGYMDDLASM